MLAPPDSERSEGHLAPTPRPDYSKNNSNDEGHRPSEQQQQQFGMIHISPGFKKDLKKVQKRPKDYELIRKFVKLLKESGIQGIPAKLKPHKLYGNY